MAYTKNSFYLSLNPLYNNTGWVFHISHTVVPSRSSDLNDFFFLRCFSKRSRLDRANILWLVFDDKLWKRSQYKPEWSHQIERSATLSKELWERAQMIPIQKKFLEDFWEINITELLNGQKKPFHHPERK